MRPAIMCGRTGTPLLVGAVSDELAAALEVAAETSVTGLVCSRFVEGTWHLVADADRQIGDRPVYLAPTHKERRMPSREAVDEELARLEARGFRVSQRSDDEAHVAVLAHRGWDGASVSLAWEVNS